MRFARVLSVAVLSLHGAVVATAQNDVGATTAEWLAAGRIPELHLELSAKAKKRLQDEPRSYVKAMLRDGKQKAVVVGIKLKGSAGSFRKLHDKPGFTVDFDRFAEQAFHGLSKFHLNNAVQDDSYLREDLAYEFFRRAGLPAPRVTHARVWLGSRDLGLYVLKEGYDERFVRTRFVAPGAKPHKQAAALGNLYDGGVNGEVDDELDRDVGSGPRDYGDLKALAAACAMPQGEPRRHKLAASLDVDRFVTFMAAEVLTCHWDGYTLNPNNYRIYFHPDGRAVFLVHGTDQTFQNAHAELFPSPRGRVAKRVLAEPVWRTLYQERVRELLPLFDPPDALLKYIRDRAARLDAVIQATMVADFREEWRDHVAHLERSITERARFLREASKGGWPEVMKIPVGGALLGVLPWYKRTDCSDVKMIGGGLGMATPFGIAAARCGRCIGSWRTKILLNRGRYELRATMTTKGVVKADDYNPGAGIRISGRRRRWVAEGTSKARAVTFPFEVEDDGQEVVLVIELRASKGSVTFDKKSLRLLRIE